MNYHAATGDYDLRIWRDDNSLYRKGDPVLYRYQIQGPGAMDVIGEATGREPPKLRFFHMTRLNIAGRRCLGLQTHSGQQQRKHRSCRTEGKCPTPSEHGI